METLSNYTHVAICPSAGIGHLTPFLRLASMLASSNTTKVTLIIIRPTLSTAETNQIDKFISTHPHITLSEFQALPPDPNSAITDPFFLQYEAVSRSSHLLTTHIAALSPRPSAVFSDLMLAAGLHKSLSELGIDSFTVITTSAKFFCLMVTGRQRSFAKGEDVEIPGLDTIPVDEIPPLMYNPNHILSRLSQTNGRHLNEAKGVVLNTFEYFEPQAILALQSGKVSSDLPPVFPIGPLHTLRSAKVSTESNCMSWLDEQESKSVAFVSFGSRTAMSKDQIREIGEGLQRSGMKFLWVIKTAVVDKEDKEELKDLLGEAFFEKTKEQGLIVKEWVNQDEILSHPATGGFVTHCGWNSVMEAAQRGMPLLAWPLHGDQRANAGVVKAAGLGIWERSWGGERLVKGDEVAEKIKELMTSESLKASAKKVGEEAEKAWEADGSSRQAFNKVSSRKIS